MRFHRDVEYALIGLSAMTKEERIFSTREISLSHSVPHDLLAKILQKLAAAGILESIQGPRGGYRLSRHPKEIALTEIFEIVHGGQHVAPCLDDKECGREDSCSIRGGVMTVQSMWDEMIGRLSLWEFLGFQDSGVNQITAKGA